MIEAYKSGAESAGMELWMRVKCRMAGKTDTNLSGGWFAILYGGEEQSASYHQMIVAHLAEEDNQLIQMLPKQATFQLSLEELYRR